MESLGLNIICLFSLLIDGGFHAARFRGSKRTKRRAVQSYTKVSA